MQILNGMLNVMDGSKHMNEITDVSEDA